MPEWLFCKVTWPNNFWLELSKILCCPWNRALCNWDQKLDRRVLGVGIFQTWSLSHNTNPYILRWCFSCLSKALKQYECRHVAANMFAKNVIRRQTKNYWNNSYFRIIEETNLVAFSGACSRNILRCFAVIHSAIPHTAAAYMVIPWAFLILASICWGVVLAVTSYETSLCEDISPFISD